MPDTTEHVQARHVRRCAVVASGDLLSNLAIAALNTQAFGRGDAIKPVAMGFRIVSASAAFSVANPDASGSLLIPATSVPYDCPATNGAADTYVSGGATLGVEVYYTANPIVP